GTVVGPDGKPCTEVTAIGLDGPHATATLKSAPFTVRGLHPGRTRQLYFYHRQRNLGTYLELRGESNESLRVELRPCGSVEGRLVDRGGNPVAGTVIYFCRQGTSVNWPGGFEVKTDKDGRFRAEGLVPGQKYMMTRHVSNLADTLPRAVTVESGKKNEL